MMQKPTVVWPLGLAAAIAVVFAWGERGVAERSGQATAARPSVRPPPRTAEDRAAQARYLTGYSERKFAPLLALLATSISEEAEKKLGGILAEREIALANAREDAATAGMAFDAFCDAQVARIDAKLTQELGGAVAARVREYLVTLPQRVTIGSIEHVLIYRGAGLTVEQMEQLVGLLHRREVLPPARRPSAEEWDRFLRDKEAAYRQVLAGAADFLSTPQLAALRQELELQVGLLRVQGRSFTPANGLSRAGRPE